LTLYSVAPTPGAEAGAGAGAGHHWSCAQHSLQCGVQRIVCTTFWSAWVRGATCEMRFAALI